MTLTSSLKALGVWGSQGLLVPILGFLTPISGLLVFSCPPPIWGYWGVLIPHPILGFLSPISGLLVALG